MFETELLTTKQMAAVIRAAHYTHSVPSGKTHYFQHKAAIVLFSIPPNKNISRWLLGIDNAVWELSRLYAPDGHEPNLLTEAIANSISAFRRIEPGVQALISYADPNVGHSGFVYRAASWVALGCSEESRYYRNSSGQVASRRAFHSGSTGMRKAEIEKLGYVELKLPGKIRFAKGFTRKTRAAINRKAAMLGLQPSPSQTVHPNHPSTQGE